MMRGRVSECRNASGWFVRAVSPVLRTVFCVLLLVVSGCLHAQSLAPVKSAPLPTLDTSKPLLGIALVDRHPIALASDAAWRLDDARKAWLPLAWPDSKNVIAQGLIQDGGRAWLLTTAEGEHGSTGVARIRLDARGAHLNPLPNLPEAMANARGSATPDAIYVIGKADGGVARAFRLQPGDETPQWSPLPVWPGAKVPTTVVAQDGGLYITVPAAAGELLLRWSTDAGWTTRGRVPGRIVAGSGQALGQANVVYLVQTPGQTGARFMTFQTITGSWAELPGDAPGTVDLTGAWPDGSFWATRTAGGDHVDFGYASVQSTKQLLKWLDWVVILVYLSAMVGIGLYFYLREKRASTAGFFLGGRSIPFWAAGISLYATNTSSISFIAIPAKAFETNWQYLTNNMIAIIGLMFVAVWVVPLLRRLDLMSVFSYLETRFHPAIRMMASALCIVMQIGSRMSIILFLPALAISTITGIDVLWSILLMGGFTILYTTLGGMKAVIWTDVVQVIVMFGGALFAIGFIVHHIHGGVPAFVHTAIADHKMHMLDFSFDLTKATVWGFLFLVLFDVVLTFPKDQVLMQRILSTRSDKDAGRSVWTFAAVMLPGGFVFYLIGTALFVYYKSHPERMNPTLPIDATFPLFIAAELPMGVTGLIIAGIFAAAMSTLASIINSVSTLASVDFYEKLAKHPTPKRSVLFAEVSGVVVGLVAIGLAILLSRYDIHSLFDVSITLAGLLGGGFAGAYTLGMFTRRANAPGVAIGIASSIVLTVVAWWFKLVHPYFYLGISIMLCIVIGYVASLFFPAPTRSLRGLTVYSDGDG